MSSSLNAEIMGTNTQFCNKAAFAKFQIIKIVFISEMLFYFTVCPQAKKNGGGGQKTEEKKKTEGCGGSSPSADVIDFPDNYLHTSFFPVGHDLFYNCKPLSTQTQRWHMVVLYCKCVGEGVRGSSPRNFLS